MADALTPVVVGGPIAFGGAAIGAFIQSRREHAKWKRERRYETYLAVIQTVDRYIFLAMDAGASQEVKESFRTESTNAAAAVGLVGPDDMVQATNKFIEAVTASARSGAASGREDERLAVRKEFVELARKFTAL